MREKTLWIVLFLGNIQVYFLKLEVALNVDLGGKH